MTGAERLTLLADAPTRDAVQRALRLPTEPIADALRDLAAAQARTDAAVKELAAAQARTDASVKALAAEVKELAVEVKALAIGQREVRQALAVLSDNVGFGLEELAAIVLPGVLEREQGLHVERFARRFVLTEVGEEEIDVYAEAERDGGAVSVVGEVETRIYTGDVRKFAQKLERVARALPGAAVGVMFGFVVHPAANEAARELGVHVVASRPAA